MSEQNQKAPSRRTFLQSAGAASVTALLGGASVAPPMSAEAGVYPRREVAPPSTEKFIGVQVGAVSFVDEGIEKVLDIFQEKARINALLLAVFTYGRGIAGRQIPGQPLPDHGAQEYDTKTFHGGCYSAVHPEYYKGAAFTDFRAPDLGDFDLLASVVSRFQWRAESEHLIRYFSRSGARCSLVHPRSPSRPTLRWRSSSLPYCSMRLTTRPLGISGTTGRR